ncbi:hypothetical protein SeMB42_g01065 [Synchytrium endobioticum]|uniref:CHY-type domain-containing protein n=1 Tax=Synchytrium endobioticum TaxID=286115 RepID=A0A507DNL5_9FUNG|nr:hypothetical protein SeLEV6574_g07470 [Synchytrium endobioticum]TPX53001.1 hypothetical protein SeMB42_g01065 [Synchytrium endobioticum]
MASCERTLASGIKVKIRRKDSPTDLLYNQPSHQPPIQTEPASQTPSSSDTNRAPVIPPSVSAPLVQKSVAASSSISDTRAPVAKPQLVLAGKIDAAATPLEKAQVIRHAEIAQLLRRFPAGILSSPENNTKFSFSIAPSDPDFPFDLPSLDLVLNIPPTFPIAGPTLHVVSSVIPPHLINQVQRRWNSKAAVSVSLENKTRMSLLHLINWLDTNLEKLLIGEAEPAARFTVVRAGDNTHESSNFSTIKLGEKVANTEPTPNTSFDEKIAADDNTASEITSTDEMDNSSTTGKGTVTGTAHKGTQIRLVNLTLTNIALLRLMSLQVLITCHKCHIQNEYTISTPQFNEETWYTCNKCSAERGLRYRPTYAFTNETNLGYLDLSQCNVVDLLPSTYIATCSHCDAAVIFKHQNRGSLITNSCGQCHNKLTLAIEQVKFVKLQQSDLHKSASTVLPKRKKVKDSVNLVVGQALPKTGACQHYKYSFRWFRFACCGRLYPCDMCHEENSDNHEMVFGNRQVCGYCSRETGLGSKCVCGKLLVKDSSVTHWEGGRGQRDRTKMSRNESRKYAGLSKTTSRKSRESIGKK